MAFVAAATGVGAAVLGTGAAAGIGSTLVGGALLGAGIGGLYSGITGDGNILNSMLTGGLIGGAAGGIGGALFPGAAGYAPAAGAGLTPAAAGAAPSTLAAPTANVMTGTPAMQAANLTAASTPAQIEAAVSGMGVLGEGAASLPGMGLAAAPEIITPQIMQATGPGIANTVSKGMSGAKMLGYGLAGTSAMQLLDGRKGGIPVGGTAYPGDIRPFEYSARPVSDTGESVYPTAQYDMAGNPMLDSAERSYFDQSFKPLQTYRAGTANPNPVMAAQGGLMAAYPMEKYGPSMSNTEVPMSYMARGGIAQLGSYSDGGRMLKGPGDGMSDNIPGVIAGKQPARLADGEFVVPADVVSHLGNGSTDAGAKRLYAMMDTVRKARTGTKKQGKQIKAEKYLPA
jgi:hypothetical protein